MVLFVAAVGMGVSIFVTVVGFEWIATCGGFVERAGSRVFLYEK